MNWRFKVPPESKAEVYFSIDDDIIVGCEELTKGFAVWQESAIGNLGPLITYGPRFFQYTNTGGFQYGKTLEKNFFSIGLIGLAFISRHYMDLYYSDSWQIV